MFCRIHHYATVNAGNDHGCVCRGIADPDEAALKPQMDIKAWGKGEYSDVTEHGRSLRPDKTVGHVYD